MRPPSAPGVSITQEWRELRPGLLTGVPAFLGAVWGKPPPLLPRRFTHPEQFEVAFGKESGPRTELKVAVRGFFENGGQQCWIVPLGDTRTLKEGLDCLRDEEGFDLVCAPGLPPAEQGDLVASQLQLLEFCARRGNCFALLDPPAGVDEPTLLDHRRRLGLGASDLGYGALYAPRIRVADQEAFLPPSGHVAGLFARMERGSGFAKAPANEELMGVVEVEPSAPSPVWLNEHGINGLRALPGRGIRVMGARTLSREADWRYVSVRRLFITLRRQLARELAWAAFEPNDLRLWLRLHREVGALLEAFFQQGAFQGATPEEAFYVKCDAENNPLAVRDQGGLVVEIGLAPSTPREFIVLHLVRHEAGRLETTGP